MRTAFQQKNQSRKISVQRGNKMFSGFPTVTSTTIKSDSEFQMVFLFSLKIPINFDFFVVVVCWIRCAMRAFNTLIRCHVQYIKNAIKLLNSLNILSNFLFHFRQLNFSGCYLYDEHLKACSAVWIARIRTNLGVNPL